MKIALLGYGRMGQVIAGVAQRRNIETVMHFDLYRPFQADEATRQALAEVDALLDFTSAEAVLPNVRTATALSIPIVIGTTGWYGELEAARRAVEASAIGLVYGANFSLGVNLFYKIVKRAGELFAAFEDYDPFIEEAHHKMKRDAPSGTALTIQKMLAENYGDRRLPVTSVRAGHIPGMHSVSFDSGVDTIRLEHTARSGEGFAEGALLAASWIVNRRGFYEFQEVLDMILRPNP